MREVKSVTKKLKLSFCRCWWVYRGTWSVFSGVREHSGQLHLQMRGRLGKGTRWSNLQEEGRWALFTSYDNWHSAVLFGQCRIEDLSLSCSFLLMSFCFPLFPTNNAMLLLFRSVQLVAARFSFRQQVSLISFLFRCRHWTLVGVHQSILHPRVIHWRSLLPTAAGGPAERCGCRLRLCGEQALLHRRAGQTDPEDGHERQQSRKTGNVTFSHLHNNVWRFKKFSDVLMRRYVGSFSPTETILVQIDQISSIVRSLQIGGVSFFRCGTICLAQRASQ